MAYVKTTWATGDVITAEKMNNIEDGIANNDGAVRYDVTQTLTDVQKARARENIGGANGEDVASLNNALTYNQDAILKDLGVATGTATSAGRYVKTNCLSNLKLKQGHHYSAKFTTATAETTIYIYLIDANQNTLVSGTISVGSITATLTYNPQSDIVANVAFQVGTTDPITVTGELSDADAAILNLDSQLQEHEFKINSLESTSYVYSLDGLCELGTAYLSGGNVVYSSVNTCVRIKRNTTIALKKDDVVVVENTPYTVRIIHVSTPNTSVGYIAENYTIPEDGNYILIFTTPQATTVTVDEVLKSVFVVRSNTAISRTVQDLDTRVTALESIDTTPSLDNEAKGVFCIMQYNCGSWYNGSGTNVPAEKYDRFLAIQEGIIDRYMPNILCIQEYANNISTGHSAVNDLLAKRYRFVVTAKGNTTYDGKAICTSQTLTDAENIEFTNTDGNLHRNYEKAYIYCNGRKVCVVATHFALLTNTISAEITELLNDIVNEDYVIICADTNINADSSTPEYESTLKQFTDAGYTLANNGQYITAPNGDWTIDNIILSSNIEIKSVIVDHQKEGLEEGEDHYPFIIYAEIY